MIRKNANYPLGRIPYQTIWEKIEFTARAYLRTVHTIIDTNRVFLCVTVVGCKNVATEGSSNDDAYGIIDRDIVLCNPISIEDIADESIIENAVKRQELDFLFAMGIQYQPQINKLIDEVQL